MAAVFRSTGDQNPQPAFDFPFVLFEQFENIGKIRWKDRSLLSLDQVLHLETRQPWYDHVRRCR
ncbi:MAG: hypothetical protein ACI93T_002784, partial [Porticoccaceae bacterium]